MALQPAGLLFLAVSIPIAFCDLRTRRIPDALSLGGLAAALALAALATPSAFTARLGASAASCGLFLTLRVASGGRLGMGDVKYSAFIGAALGFEGWFAALLCASLLGLLAVAALLAAGGLSRDEPIPFAPFLAAGGTAWIAAGAELLRILDATGPP